MKKSILNLGKALNRAEQKSVNGGGIGSCRSGNDMGNGCLCHKGSTCNSGSCNKKSGHILGHCGV